MRMFRLTLIPTFSKGDDSHAAYGNLAVVEEEEKCQEIRRWIIILLYG